MIYIEKERQNKNVAISFAHYNMYKYLNLFTLFNQENFSQLNSVH